MNSCELITDFCDFSEYDDYVESNFGLKASDKAAWESELAIAGGDPDKIAMINNKYENIKNADSLTAKANLARGYAKKYGFDFDIDKSGDIDRAIDLGRKFRNLEQVNKRKDKSIAKLATDRDFYRGEAKALKEDLMKNNEADNKLLEDYKNRKLTQKIKDTWRSGTKGKLALGGAAAATAAVGTLAGLGIAGARGVGPMASDSAKAKRVERLIAEGNTAKAMQVANSIKSEVIRNAILSRYAAPALPSY